MKTIRFLYSVNKINPDKKWYQFWKPSFICKTYDMSVKNGKVVLGKEIK